MSTKTCQECGRPYDNSIARGCEANRYCSAKCERAAKAAGGSSARAAPFQASLIAKAQKASGADNSGGLKLAVPIIGILIIIGLIGMAVNSIQNAFSDTKIKIVSASCETQEKFVSILEKALSGG